MELRELLGSGCAQRFEQFRRGSAAAGIERRGRDFSQRDEHEGAISQAGMGDLQIRFFDSEMVEQQNIQVKCAWAVGDACGAVAVERVLDGQKSAKQLPRIQICFQRYDRVYKARLIGEADRGGRIERGAGKDAAQRFQPRDGGG